MTFLSGCGFFDWAHSILMDDVLNDRIKFGGTSQRVDIFTEDEIFELIEEFKTSQSCQKSLRDPENLQKVMKIMGGECRPQHLASLWKP